MSEWDKAKLSWDQKTLIDEGNRMQERIEELETINIELAIRYGSLIKKNIDTEQKLEAIREIVMKYNDLGLDGYSWDWDEPVEKILEVLSE